MKKIIQPHPPAPSPGRRGGEVLKYLLFLFFILTSTHLFADSPTTGEVLKFDPVKQSDPRISFSKGVEESVAPASGGLTVKIPVLNLAVRSMPVDVSFHYNSSMVPVFNEEEIGGGPWGHIAIINNLSFSPQTGGLLYNKYGLSSYSGFISEGMLMDIITFILKKVNIIAGQISSFIMKYFHWDIWNNTNVHTFIPQMQLCTGPVRGLVGDVEQYPNLNMVNPATLYTMKADTAAGQTLIKYIHPLNSVNVILSDGSTINFQKKGTVTLHWASEAEYDNKQPDDHYKLVYKDGLYYFETGDGSRYTIKPYLNYMQYFGFGNFSLTGLDSLMKDIDKLGNVDISSMFQMGDKTDLANFSEDFLGPLTSVMEALGSAISVYVLPYGVTTKIEDNHDNFVDISYENDILGCPRRMSKITDSLGREMTLSYSEDDLFHPTFSSFYRLKEIKRPDGEKFNIEWKGEYDRTSPTSMILKDPLQRTTSCYFHPFPKDENLILAGIQNDFYYMNRIDYPIGGYVEYDIAPLDSDVSKHYYYRDMDLTAFFVKSRMEHTSPPGLPGDIVETTRFEYNYPWQKDTIITGALYYTPPSLDDLLSLDWKKMVGTLSGGLYLKAIRTVPSGTTTVFRNNGTIEKYSQVKSNPKNYNHHIMAMGVQANGFLYTLFNPLNVQLGYKPSRTLLTSVETIPPSGSGLENSLEINSYNIPPTLTWTQDDLPGNTWQLSSKTTTKGGITTIQKYLSYDKFGQLTAQEGPFIGASGADASFALRQETSYLYESDNKYIDYGYNAKGNGKFSKAFLPSLVREEIVKDNGTIKRRTVNEYDNGNPGSYVYGYMGDQTATKQYTQNGTHEEIVQRMEYNNFGEVTKTTLEDSENGNRVTENEYNFSADPLVITSKNKNVTQTDPDTGTVKPTKEDIKSIKRFARNNNFLLEEENNVGEKTIYGNDTLGRVLDVTFPDNTKLKYKYFDVKGNLRVMVKDQEQLNINPNLSEVGSFILYKYDGLGRLKTLEQHLDSSENSGTPLLYSSENFYDANGNLTKVKDAQNRETKLTYDAYKRLRKITYPDNTELSTAYDYSHPDFYYQTLTDAKTNTTKYKFDPLGRLIEVEEEQNPGIFVQTGYAYDKFGNLLLFQNKKSALASYLTTLYEYDDLNRLVKETYPDTSFFSYTHDKSGNIQKKRDARNAEIKYHYDELNRLLRVEYPTTAGNIAPQSDVYFSYDTENNRVLTKAGEICSKYAYNTRNWLTNEKVALPLRSPLTLKYAYNQSGDIIAMEYPLEGRHNYKLTYDLNTLHRVRSTSLIHATDPPKVLANYAYNPMGTVSAVTFGNGAVQNFIYDSRDRLLNFNVLKSGASLLSEAYAYDKVGNRIQTTEDNGRVIKYGYDKVYRLTKVLRPGNYPTKDKDTTYTYDYNGNRTLLDHAYGQNEYEYANNSDELLKIKIDTVGSIAYTYDANGNLTSETRKRNEEIIKQANYSWDFENKLTSIAYPRNMLENFKDKDKIKDSFLEFIYNPDGQRVKKTVKYGEIEDASTIYLLGSGGQTLREYELQMVGNNVTKETTTYFPGVARTKGTGLEYYVKDALGSTIALLNDTNVIQRNKYDPFGDIEASKGTSDNKFNFTGKETDEESGLIYFGSRYYNPLIGRWVSRDPLAGKITKPQGLNRYQYCYNNPLINIDPDGQDIFFFGDDEIFAPESILKQGKISDPVVAKPEVMPIEEPLNFEKPLPAPDNLIKQGWKDVTDPRNSSGNKDLVNDKTGDKLRYDVGDDKGVQGKQDPHYHRLNPKSTGKKDMYLDKNGKPCAKYSKESHLETQKGGVFNTIINKVLNFFKSNPSTEKQSNPYEVRT